MEETKNNAMSEMENAVKNLFDSVDNLVNAVEEELAKRMIFVINRTEHYKGEYPKGVGILETNSFEDLRAHGFELGVPYQRGRFAGDYGKQYKCIEEMRIGTILKSQSGEYIQRIK